MFLYVGAKGRSTTGYLITYTMKEGEEGYYGEGREETKELEIDTYALGIDTPIPRGNYFYTVC